MDPTAGFGFAAGLVAMGAVVHYMRNQVASGAIGRNSAVGIRTRATMASDGAWRAGHAAAAPMLTVAFLTAYAAAATSLALAAASASTGSGSPAAVIVPAAGTVAFLALLVTAAIKANSAARAADGQDPPFGPH
ncbi:SdpI family protein [Streptomyces sp. NPDC127110]|uniref:SdpI family protein n=1 Tax=Streptomyces sp. NPDC127110 TaxID=3345362 RepID=UPI003631CF91